MNNAVVRVDVFYTSKNVSFIVDAKQVEVDGDILAVEREGSHSVGEIRRADLPVDDMIAKELWENIQREGYGRLVEVLDFMSPLVSFSNRYNSRSAAAVSKRGRRVCSRDYLGARRRRR